MTCHLSFYLRWVLTAAHCLPSGEQTSKVWVYIGNIFSHINKRKRTEKIKAKAIFIHPNYAGTGFKGSSSFSTIQFLCFSPSTDCSLASYVRSEGWIAS